MRDNSAYQTPSHMNTQFHTPKPLEAAYLAGIIDGEGSLVMQRRRSRNSFHWTVSMRVGSCDRPLISWLHQFGGFCLWDRNTHKAGRRPHHEWHATGSHLRRVLPPAAPFLIIKKDKAEWVLRVLEIQAARTQKSGHGGNPTHVRYSPEDRAELEAIHQKFMDARTARIAARNPKR